MRGRSFPQTLFRVFENDPSARGFIVDLLCQPPLEARIGLAIQRDQMRREVAALGGREALSLLLQLGKTHAGNVASGRIASTGETRYRIVRPKWIGLSGRKSAVDRRITQPDVLWKFYVLLFGSNLKGGGSLNLSAPGGSGSGTILIVLPDTVDTVVAWNIASSVGSKRSVADILLLDNLSCLKTSVEDRSG